MKEEKELCETKTEEQSESLSEALKDVLAGNDAEAHEVAPTEEPSEPQDDKIPLDPELGIDPEQLSSELENLKDLFQGEIDKMMDENPDADWKEIVNAARDEKIAKKSAPKSLICECCGEEYLGENPHYCDKCLKIMKHYPFEWWKFIIPVVTVVLLVLSFVFFAISWPVFEGAVEADHLARSGKLVSALNKYDRINTEIKVTDKNYGNKYLRRQVAIYDQIGTDCYSELSAFIDEHFTLNSLKNKENADVQAVKDKVTSFSEAYEFFETASAGTNTYTAFCEKYDKIIAGKDLNKGMTAYYKYYAALYYGADSDAQLKAIDTIKAADPDLKSLYLPLYAEYYLNQGQYDTVLKYASQLEETNLESIYVSLYRAVAYRLKGNINMAFTSAQKGIKISSYDTLINYQMGVISLLQGKTKEAMNYASIAYQYADNPNAYTSAASLYALCAGLTNDTSIFNSTVKDVTENGYAISDDVQKILDGSLSIEDVFTKGKGDFSW